MLITVLGASVPLGQSDTTQMESETTRFRYHKNTVLITTHKFFHSITTSVKQNKRGRRKAKEGSQ